MSNKTLTQVINEINAMPYDRAVKAWNKLSPFERMLVKDSFKYQDKDNYLVRK
jgi:hypothetical protein